MRGGSYVLHFELLAVALGQHARVGEREPAAPGNESRERLKFGMFAVSAGAVELAKEEAAAEAEEDESRSPHILFFSFSP